MQALPLIVKQYGTIGQPLVLLNGWAMPNSIWQQMIASLSNNYQIYTVALANDYQQPFDLTDLVLALKQQLPAAIYLGWSLGGCLALQLAYCYPKQVKALLLLATTPQFVADNDWQSAINAKLWLGFVKQLRQDKKALLNKFIHLQLLGSPNRLQYHKLLWQQLNANGWANVLLLENLLVVLSSIQLVDKLKYIQPASLWILGQNDKLIPNTIADTISTKQASARVEVIANSGHIPFIVQTEQVMRLIDNFLEHHYAS